MMGLEQDSVCLEYALATEVLRFSETVPVIYCYRRGSCCACWAGTGRGQAAAGPGQEVTPAEVARR